MFPAPSAAISASVSHDELGPASGVNNAIREIAATLGIAVVALAFTSAGSFTNHATVAHGFRAAAGLCAILSVAGALIRTRPGDGNPDRPVPASLIEEATP